MGHVRLGTLPKTKAWRDVVSLLDGGGGVAQVAQAASKASRVGLDAAKRDPGVVEALWLLVQLPLAARGEDFVESLRSSGLAVDEAPSVLGLTTAMTALLDARLRGARKTDVSEMAALAAVETVASVVGARVPSLFAAEAADVRSAVAGLATQKQFGAFTRAFFARFTERYLAYYLSRELSAHVGRGQRFASIDDHDAFNAALRVHCHEAARIVETFAGDWFSKGNWKRDLTRPATQRFAAVAFKKLEAELAHREERGGAR